jgi:transposase-like protein
METAPRMGTNRRVFSKECKAAAVRRLEMGASASEVARALQVNPNVVHRWRREWWNFGAQAFGGYGNSRTEVAPRTRAVMFRLTDLEFDSLEKARAKGGARSLSDFVRTQVLSGTDQPSLAKIESKLNELAQTAQQIVSAVRRFEGS